MKCKELCAKYKVDKSTVYKILKNSLKFKGLSHSKKQKKHMRKSSFPEVEKALLMWFNEVRSKGTVITTLMLLNKAKQFALQLEKDFDPNPSWLFRWRQRNGINISKISGESQASDQIGAEEFLKNTLPEFMQKYDPANVFNADETGLYFKALPSTTYCTKGSQSKGWKSEKSRLTILFVCNSSGDYKKLFIVGKTKKPRCFKNKNIPIQQYFANKNAWMTGCIWDQILSHLDKEMEKLNKKIVLFVDNASCHKTTMDLDNIELIFLPPNTTSIIQPLDQGIIHSFKSHYRQIIVHKQICAIEKGLTVPEFIKSVSVLDALHFIKRAWWLVTPETIVNCFKKVKCTF